MQRIIVGLGIGGAVTFALFVLMAYLIKADVRPPLEEATITVQINMVEPDDGVKLRERRVPKRPEPPKNPPPPDRKVTKAKRPKIQSMNLNMGKLDVGLAGNGLYLGPVGGAMGDGEAIPMVIIQPRYPPKAMMEGIEGWVKFKFNISPDGTPSDIQLIDAQPKRLFASSARKAIRKWKFKPNVVDGKAVVQLNMVYTMKFRLASE